MDQLFNKASKIGKAMYNAATHPDQYQNPQGQQPYPQQHGGPAQYGQQHNLTNPPPIPSNKPYSYAQHAQTPSTASSTISPPAPYGNPAYGGHQHSPSPAPMYSHHQQSQPQSSHGEFQPQQSSTGNMILSYSSNPMPQAQHTSQWNQNPPPHPSHTPISPLASTPTYASTPVTGHHTSQQESGILPGPPLNPPPNHVGQWQQSNQQLPSIGKVSPVGQYPTPSSGYSQPYGNPNSNYQPSTNPHDMPPPPSPYSGYTPIDTNSHDPTLTSASHGSYALPPPSLPAASKPTQPSNHFVTELPADMPIELPAELPNHLSPSQSNSYPPLPPRPATVATQASSMSLPTNPPTPQPLHAASADASIAHLDQPKPIHPESTAAATAQQIASMTPLSPPIANAPPPLGIGQSQPFLQTHTPQSLSAAMAAQSAPSNPSQQFHAPPILPPPDFISQSAQNSAPPHQTPHYQPYHPGPTLPPIHHTPLPHEAGTPYSAYTPPQPTSLPPSNISYAPQTYPPASLNGVSGTGAHHSYTAYHPPQPQQPPFVPGQHGPLSSVPPSFLSASPMSGSPGSYGGYHTPVNGSSDPSGYHMNGGGAMGQGHVQAQGMGTGYSSQQR